MEGAIALNRCYGPALRQVGRVRGWCWRASFRLDILMFIATSFEPYHSSLSSVNIKSKQSAVDQICCTVPKLKQREREIAHIE